LYYKFIGHSFVDSPSTCAVVYVRGCNRLCNYCYNTDLLSSKQQEGDLLIDDLLQKLISLVKVNTKTNQTYTTVEWLIITGGEPLLSKDISELYNIITYAKTIGLKVGIYTNGDFYENLELILYSNLIDLIHIDYKDLDLTEDTKKSIKLSKKAYFNNRLQYFILNTTLLKSQHTLEYLLEMKKELNNICGGNLPEIKLASNISHKEKYVWTLTPFFNNNDKIKTLGLLKSIDESLSTALQKELLNGLCQLDSSSF
jgi:organic radical activating enzyme